MTTARKLQTMTYSEYLAFEAQADQKHEFIAGEVYAMAGGTLEHSAISTALLRAVANALEGRPCRVYNSDARVRVQDSKFTSYPDVSVVCGEAKTAPDDAHGLLNPIVLIEVLSESTEAYDRGAKAMHYRRIASLKEYVLVSTSERLVEVQRRNTLGYWELHTFGPGEVVQLESVKVQLSVDQLYFNPLSQ